MHCLTGECAAIAEKGFQGQPGWGLGRYLCSGVIEPGFEHGNLWCGFLLAYGQPVIGRQAPDLFFDTIDRRNLLEALFGDVGCIVVG